MVDLRVGNSSLRYDDHGYTPDGAKKKGGPFSTGRLVQFGCDSN
jgi:hypothetical protein